MARHETQVDWIVEMSRQLAEMVLASRQDASLWLELHDAFLDEGFLDEAFVLKVAGMTQDMIEKAEDRLNG